MGKISEKTPCSIRSINIITFSVVLLLSIGVIEYLVFSNWISSAKQIMETLAEDMSEEIYTQTHTLMDVPVHINEVNYKLLESAAIDLSDDVIRDRFFVGIINSHGPEIFSFNYGAENGEYYGAHRTADGDIQILRNNADTQGHCWHYSIGEDLTAENLVRQSEAFDVRACNWYKVARESYSSTFSDVYKNNITGELTVSATRPIYSEQKILQGVLKTDILLSSIGDSLETQVKDVSAYAVIVERKSGQLIANSFGIENFTTLQDSSIKRTKIGELSDTSVGQAFSENEIPGNSQFVFRADNENFYINTKEFLSDGLDWVIISALPESLLMADVIKNIQMTVALAALTILLAIGLFFIVEKRLLFPMKNLLTVADSISAGNISDRALIVRNDEIGKLSGAFNRMADTLSYLINNLEDTVDIRTEDLEASKDRLRLLLDSTAEAIFGINNEGKCTFCNISSIKLLGYAAQEDLLGQDIHDKIHHSKPDGTPFPVEDCSIIRAIKTQKGVYVDDEVFWKADGTYFFVEYRAYPQIINGKVVGAVVSFTDISQRKKKEEEIRFLSRHDILTGLYNRSYFEESLKSIDSPENLPLSLIFADINGLKMTNDIFGHATGDSLIKKSSKILMESCRKDDFIARVGGDEFVLILPKTNAEEANKVISHIRIGFYGTRVSGIKCSISLGSDTKTHPSQSIEERMSNAENAMYKDKTLNRKSVNRNTLDTIVETLHTKSAKERQHSIAISDLCCKIGACLNLPSTEISKLKQVGYLHDIGKVVLDERILRGKGLTEADIENLNQHPAVGYRILNLFDDTLGLAESVYAHHERWDGYGFPKGLRGEEIPLHSRVIALANALEKVAIDTDSFLPLDKLKAVQIIKEGQGKQFDPAISELLVQTIEYQNG